MEGEPLTVLPHHPEHGSRLLQYVQQLGHLEDDGLVLSLLCLEQYTWAVAITKLSFLDWSNGLVLCSMALVRIHLVQGLCCFLSNILFIMIIPVLIEFSLIFTSISADSACPRLGSVNCVLAYLAC